MNTKWITSLFVCLLFACTPKKQSVKDSPTKKQTLDMNSNTLKKERFDTILQGKPVKLFWLENGDIKMAMTNYGGRIVGLYVPDKKGDLIDVNIGYGSIKTYLEADETYFGATIGRVGNRIAKGKFTLNGTEFSVPTNNNGNALHGGYKGFQSVVWEAQQPNKYTLILQYTSPDMEEGFPGNLKTKVTYSLTSENAVRIQYKASTDKPTLVNLTNHAYFNLNGEGSGTILNHKMQLFAEAFTPVDAGLIPTGELRPVSGTPFDFTQPRTIGERVEADNEQLHFGGGYDHNYVLGAKQEKSMNHAAKVVGDISKITMNVYTKEPGVQFYGGNFMGSKNTLKSGAKDDARTAFCLETQHFPDAPNQPNFPSIQLNPGETYTTSSEYHFSVE